jgi:hypothetical protein
VLNTPPQWTIDAQEDNYDSSTSTPTNAGDLIRWRALGTDSSADPYWLIICKTNVTPSPNANAAPTCNGGAVNQWAVSVGTTTGGGTTSGFVAIAATTTKEGFPFNAEKNDWYGYICDGNITLPLCNVIMKQGVSTPGPSPFFIDHPPAFTTLASNNGQNPGGTVTWTTTATTTDIIRGGDSLRLYVCKAADFTFASSTAGCGAGGTWATSTLTKINPTASYVIPIPTQDFSYPAFIYLANNFNLAATSTLEGSSSPLTVNNVAPTIASSTITLIDRTGTSTPTLGLVTPNGKSTGYQITFQVTDNNSCLNHSGGNEIASVAATAFRQNATTSLGVCPYNSNNCYPSTSAFTDFVCTQNTSLATGDICTGATDTAVQWNCTFSLWYNADPTDTGSVFAGQKWFAAASSTDDNGLTSPMGESTIGQKTLNSFLAFAVTQSSIAYGGLQPGNSLDLNLPVTPTTTLNAYGNTGIDESLYGETMCVGWTSTGNQSYCDGTNNFDTTKDVFSTSQKAATSAVTYVSSSAFPLQGSTSAQILGLHVLKTTATSSPQNKNTFWGINIPGSTTQSGAYTGQNTIIAVTSSSTNL